MRGLERAVLMGEAGVVAGLFAGRRSINAKRHREVAIDRMLRGLSSSGGRAR